ncbi:MAG: hypothetical protein A2W01_08890 [Candidatus Solincola sediminis]|nr:MAG: hypothetical protein A2W01_08890 [Candidatus Solincola sediminis]
MSNAAKAVRTLIIGAGVAGLSLGCYLRDGDFLILEKEEGAGGYLKQICNGDFSFDIGVKCIHASSSEVVHFVEEIVGEENLDRGYARSAYLNHGKLHALPRLEHPVQPLGKRADFRAYAFANYGELAESYMIPYAEKTWTAPASEIDYRAAVTKSKAPGGYLYPRGGMQELTDRMAERLGDHLRLHSKVTEVDPKAKTVKLAGGEIMCYQRLISTVPLPQLIRMIAGVPAEVGSAADKLNFNSMATVAVALEGCIGVEYHYVLVPERRYSFRRLSFPRNFSPGLVPPGRDSILAEVNLPRGERNMACDAEHRGDFIQAVLGQIAETGLLRACRVLGANLTWVGLAHIVPDFCWRPSLDVLEGFLKSRGIRTLGRFAEWKYMNIDDTILEASAISKDILGGRRIRPAAMEARTIQHKTDIARDSL